MPYLSAFFHFSNFGLLTNNIEFFVQYHVVFLVLISWLLAGTPSKSISLLANINNVLSYI